MTSMRTLMRILLQPTQLVAPRVSHHLPESALISLVLAKFCRSDSSPEVTSMDIILPSSSPKPIPNPLSTSGKSKIPPIHSEGPGPRTVSPSSPPSTQILSSHISSAPTNPLPSSNSSIIPALPSSSMPPVSHSDTIPPHSSTFPVIQRRSPPQSRSLSHFCFC